MLAGYGLRHALLYALGIGLGVTLYRSRFGFASAFRQLAWGGSGRGVYAHLLMLAAASVFFALLLATPHGFFGVHPHGFVFPLGVNVMVGAFLFGLGTPLGGACSAGTLYDIGGGYVALLCTLTGFVAGSVLGAWHRPFWTRTLPTLPPLSLAQRRWGYGGAVLVQLGVLGILAVAIGVITHRRRAPPARPRPSPASAFARIVRGMWPQWVGALLLALLDALTLLLKGSPWGVTTAFALAGSQLAAAVGVPVSSWPYWSGSRGAALHAPLLADSTVVMDLGIILGALLASSLAGTFALRKPIAWQTAATAVVGGLLMGYGAILAHGCTADGYLGGIASFSLHGWAWAIMGLVGTFLGVRLAPLFHLPAVQPDKPDW